MNSRGKSGAITKHPFLSRLIQGYPGIVYRSGYPGISLYKSGGWQGVIFSDGISRKLVIEVSSVQFL